MDSTPQAALDPDARHLLLALAREALERSVRGEPPPEFEACKLPPGLAGARGCFVTLTCGGELRGCIGVVEPDAPLWRSVLENARAAALQDARFEPVTQAELGDINVEISVLSVPKRLEFTSPEDLLAKLRPGWDGVLLELGARRATFLPQVWEKLQDKVRFLEQLCLKAGVAPGAWRRPDAGVRVYQVEHFSEADPPLELT
jgi:AmmeMemoRadiSam system protein A